MVVFRISIVFQRMRNRIPTKWKSPRESCLVVIRQCWRLSLILAISLALPLASCKSGKGWACSINSKVKQTTLTSPLSPADVCSWRVMPTCCYLGTRKSMQAGSHLHLQRFDSAFTLEKNRNGFAKGCSKAVKPNVLLWLFFDWLKFHEISLIHSSLIHSSAGCWCSKSSKTCSSDEHLLELTSS